MTEPGMFIGNESKPFLFWPNGNFSMKIDKSFRTREVIVRNILSKK